MDACRTATIAFAISKPCTNGRHGVPSLVILISRVVHARPAKLFSTISNLILGEAPYAVAFRRNVGEKLLSAIFLRSRSTNTLHSAYAGWGFTGDCSSTKSRSATP